MHDVVHITIFTLAMAALGTLLATPPGLSLAWLLSRRDWPGKSLVETALTLPLFIPPVATGLILLKLFSRNGPIGSLAGSVFSTDIIFTWKAVVLATTVMTLPLFVRTARVAFDEVSRHAEDSARTLGAGPWQVFHRITLPLAARGLVAGLVLSFARALGEFGATSMVAGFIPGRTVTLALGIYHHVQLGQDDQALVLLSISAALAFLAVWIGDRFLRQRRQAPELP